MKAFLEGRIGSDNWSGPVSCSPLGAPKYSANPLGLTNRRETFGLANSRKTFFGRTVESGCRKPVRWECAMSVRIASGRQTVARSLQICLAGLWMMPRVRASSSSNFSPNFEWMQSQNSSALIPIFSRGMRTNFRSPLCVYNGETTPSNNLECMAVEKKHGTKY